MIAHNISYGLLGTVSLYGDSAETAQVKGRTAIFKGGAFGRWITEIGGQTPAVVFGEIRPHSFMNGLKWT